MSISRLSIRPSTGGDGGKNKVLPEMFKHRLLQLADESVNSLQQIWKEAGYEEAECHRLLGDVLDKMKKLCETEIAAEQQILEHAKIEVQSKMKEYEECCIQLGRESNLSYIKDMNYTDKLTELDRIITEISVEVSQRSELLDSEFAMIENLVEELGENTPNLDEFSGPEGTPFLSDVRLQLMQEFNKKLSIKKSQRIEEVKDLSKQNYDHMADMMYAEENFETMEDSSDYLDIDKKVYQFMQTQNFEIPINNSTVEKLKKRIKSFEEEKESRRMQLSQTGAEIARLWTLLRIPSEEREKFQNSFKMNLSMETLSKGLDELKRLKEIRATSFGKVISSIREDILVLWQEAGIESDESRKNEFPLYFEQVETLEDSAVDAHENYFNELKARVEELKPILSKVNRRETVIKERIELEHLQMNPERLTARGPNAREERKREESMSNRVKNLEKYTKELIVQIQTWEEKNGPFYFCGERYFERIIRQDEDYIEIRDSLRNARKKKDGKMDPHSTRSTFTSKKANLHGSTHFSASASKIKTTATLLNNGTSNNIDRLVDTENFPPNANRDSDGTQCTTKTEIKERNSNSSQGTVVKNSH